MTSLKPYEKLESKGAASLSNAELLAIIIRTGTKKRPALSIASQVIQLHPEGLRGVHLLGLKDFENIVGIGRVKAIQLKALAELSTRFAKASALTKFRIHSPASVANLFMEEMRYLKQEHLKVVLLDTKQQIIEDKDLFIGSVNTSVVEVRDILIYGIKKEAVSIIILHNHPSGDPEPSPQDIQVTERLERAGLLVGIDLIDHIIIGDGQYISLKEIGVIGT